MPVCIVTGESSMFTYNETLQRALLQWNRAATQGKYLLKALFVHLFYLTEIILLLKSVKPIKIEVWCNHINGKS